MLKDKLLCNLEGKIDLTSEQESPQTGFCWHRKCWQVNQSQIYSEGFIIPAFWNCNTYQVFRNTTWLVNLPIKPTLRLNKIVYTHTHSMHWSNSCPTSGDELSWLEGSTYSTDNQDISQQHSLPQSDWICACNKNEMFLDNPPFVPPVNLTSTSTNLHIHIRVGGPTQYTSGK